MKSALRLPFRMTTVDVEHRFHELNKVRVAMGMSPYSLSSLTTSTHENRGYRLNGQPIGDWAREACIYLDGMTEGLRQVMRILGIKEKG